MDESELQDDVFAISSSFAVTFYFSLNRNLTHICSNFFPSVPDDLTPEEQQELENIRRRKQELLEDIQVSELFVRMCHLFLNRSVSLKMKGQPSFWVSSVYLLSVIFFSRLIELAF